MLTTPTKADVPWPGVIADDYTGASDAAGTLANAGMRVVPTFGIPDPSRQLHEVDCIVVSLKTRSLSAPEAVEQSLAAARALKARGVRQLYFKYCSTFDSTSDGKYRAGGRRPAQGVRAQPPGHSCCSRNPGTAADRV